MKQLITPDDDLRVCCPLVGVDGYGDGYSHGDGHGDSQFQFMTSEVRENMQKCSEYKMYDQGSDGHSPKCGSYLPCYQDYDNL
jgi:hypothetical protein